MSKEHGEFILQLRKEFPAKSETELIEFAQTIERMGSKYKQYQLYQCNVGPLKPSDARSETRLEESAKKLVKDFGLPGIELQGDPRGYTIKLLLPSGRSNNFGGTHWGVPRS